MATSVQVELKVDSQGAVTGVRNVDTALKGITPTAQQLDATLNRLNATLEQMSIKGKKAGSETEKALSGSRRAATEALHETHLLTEEFDIHLPRAMQRIVAQSKIAQTALSALGPLMMGIGTAQIGIMVGEQVYEGVKKLYEKWVDVDGAIERYNEQASEAASKRFFENSGVEQLAADLQEANDQIDQINQKKDTAAKLWKGLQAQGGGPGTAFDIGSGGLAPVGLGLVDTKTINPNFGMSMEDAGKLNAAQGKSDETELRLMEEKHKKYLAEIEDAKILNQARVSGIEKERAARDAADRAADENRRFQIERAKKNAEIANRGKSEGDPGYVTVRQDFGDAENAIAKQHNAAVLRAHESEKEKSDAQELRRIREEALESGLRGSALYAAQEKAAIDELKEKHIATEQAVEDTRAKFHNLQMRRMQEEDRKIQEMREHTQLAGLTGPARIRQDEQNKIADVHRNSADLTPEQMRAEVEAIHEEAAQQIAALNTSFAERVDQIANEAATRELTGFARIAAEADNKIHALEKDFKRNGGTQEDLDRGKAAYKQAAGDQSVAMMQKISDETANIEAEARAKSLSGERQKTAAIQAEYQARVQKLEEWRRKELEGAAGNAREIEAINEAADRREAAAAQERDAEMVEAARAAREKMAGEFSHLFKSLDHPMEALQEVGDKVAGEAAASLVQRIQQHAQKGKNGAPESAPDEDRGGFFGEIVGGFGFGGKKHGTGSRKNPQLPPAAGAVAGSAGSVFTVSSAMIHIASASLSFGAGGSAASAAGSGTSLLHGSQPTGGFAATGESSTSATGTSSSPTPSASSHHSGGLIGSAFGSMTRLFRGAPHANGSNQGSSSAASSSAVPAGNTGMVGGAGDSSLPASGNFAIGSGTPPPQGAGLVGALSDVSQGIQFAQSAKSTFGSAGSKNSSGSSDLETQGDPLSGTLNADGSFTSSSSGSSTNSGLLGGSDTAGNVMGAASGAIGMYSAYEGNGGVGGALSGAMSGMQLGMALGGPMGAAIGAAAGAIVGAIGFGGREKARVYDLKTVRPRLTNDTDSFQQGSMDYLTAYSDMESAQTDASHTVSKMGPAANSYYQDTIKPEIATAEQKLTREAKAGRSASTFSAAQFDTGGPIDNFGDLATSPDHGLVHAQLGEFVVKPNVYQRNKSTLDALNSGASMDAVHASYQATMQSRDARNNSSGGDRTLNMHVYAHDSKSVAQFFDENMHHIRRGLNSSYSSYGGLADA